MLPEAAKAVAVSTAKELSNLDWLERLKLPVAERSATVGAEDMISPWLAKI